MESSNVFFGKVPDSQVSQHDWFISKYTPDLRQSMYSVHIEGMIVAFVSLCNIDEFACNAEIGRFLALESIKGKGMFTDILASLLCFCGRKLGIMHTYLLVKNTNCNSIGLYKKLGFTEDAPSISDDYLRMDLRDIKLADFFDNIAISML